MIYDSNVTPKTITLQDPNSNTITQYKLEGSSVITEAITPTTTANLVFRADKTLEDGATATYKICDSSSTSETGSQISINGIAHITTTIAGSC